jgi:ParB-like chromosome segregation protein Spo0J
MMEHKVLKPLEGFLVDVSSLTPDTANARVHDTRNIEAIENSLKTFGQHQPIIVQEEGMIVRIGNGRLEAARNLGWKKIAALVVAESNVEAISRAIADNKTAELATWDYEILGDLFRGLEEDGVDLAMIGFAGDELLVMNEELPSNAGDLGEIPEGNKELNEEELAETDSECPSCGFKWKS